MKYFESMEQFTKTVAVISIIIVSLGFISLVVFYELFNIDIFEFISISEIITTSFSLLLSLFIPIFISFFILQKLLTKAWMYRNNVKMVHGIIFNPLRIYVFLIVLASIYSWLQIYGIFLTKNSFLIEIFNIVFATSFLITTSLLTMGFAFAFFHRKKKIVILRTKIIVLFSTIIFGLFFILVTTQKAFLLINSNPYRATTFYLNNTSKIVTNDSIKFIGKTQGYYFLWNKKTEVSTVYPASEIIKIEYSRPE